MTKEEANKVIKCLRTYYPYAFRKQSREELKDYVLMFYKEFLKYDLELMARTIERIVKEKKYMPNFIEIEQYLCDQIIGRLYNILEIIRKENYFYEGLVERKDKSISLQELDRYDAILVELIMNNLSEKSKKMFIDKVEEYESLKDYRGKLFFTDGLPNPPGYNPDYNCKFEFRNRRPKATEW